ncbi:MAG: alpha-amylase family glycosyl hydrolase, partial [Bacteroidetes bacterium]|nr:alpha-amylase family glycosyl hydrolase [Bacteroidota bacterium]
MKPTSLYVIMLLTAGLIVSSCNESATNRSTSDRVVDAVSQDFNWKTANVYFLLTDRFNKGNSETRRTDVPVATATLRGFEGGNLKGITEKLNEGYFEDLGVDAIWMTPFVRQIDAPTDEGTGVTYGYHGYWAKDWTNLDPNFGTYDEL